MKMIITNGTKLNVENGYYLFITGRWQYWEIKKDSQNKKELDINDYELISYNELERDVIHHLKEDRSITYKFIYE